ncbi:hypothetical protein C6502_20905 [Candidatus Poribacteria bacterium]|nr:MAG: hypothetical protein C6502_20905 [Candidatus Poribacteria bacterium]
MRKVLERCPTCGGELTITGMHCRSCHTRIESEYSTCRFCRLSQEDLDFIEVFVRNRGNIREMERELEISYPTVRSRLNAVIKELGYEVEAEPAASAEVAEERRAILKRLSEGEISAAEATELINQLRGK